MSSTRQANHPIHPLFLQRWSPRAFGPQAIDETTLFTLFEAARWAPSASNAQPWRFIYALRDDADWPGFVALLAERNRVWAGQAAALLLLVSKTTRIRAGEQQPTRSRSHAFDTGAAWQSLALQAVASGRHTRAMGGFDRDQARVALAIPADHEPEVVIAIGRQAAAATLPPAWRDAEAPNGRRPLQALVARGRFDFDDDDAAGAHPAAALSGR